MSYIDHLEEFREKIKEVLDIAKKPSGREYWMVAKIVLFGIILLGGLSFTIQLIFAVILTV